MLPRSRKIPKGYSLSRYNKAWSLIVILSMFIGLLSASYMIVIGTNMGAEQVPNMARGPRGPRAEDTEPNDNFPNAIPLTNDIVNGEATNPDQVDYYKVDLSAGQTMAIHFTTHPDGTKNLTLKLFNSTGTELWHSGWVQPGKARNYNYTINRTSHGPYYLGVFAEEYGNFYTLQTTISSQNDAATGTDAPDNLPSAKEIFAGNIKGFVGGVDVNDFYKFKVSPGRIINFNFSVNSDGDQLGFDIYNDTNYYKIKAIPAVNQGGYKTFEYTTNSNGSRMFYIGVHADNNARNHYNITVLTHAQEDAFSYQDAGDNISSAMEIPEPGIYSGWLASGNAGLDSNDIYFFIIPKGNWTVYLNITPAATLDLIINLEHETTGLLKAVNPGLGVLTNITINYTTSSTAKLYLSLMIAQGMTSSGEYSIEFNYDRAGEPNPDMDADGLLDAWELDYFESIGEYSAGSDPDTDGYTNLEEFLAETDPTNASSHPGDGDDGTDSSHLTVAACAREYDDPVKDVLYWSGTYNETTNDTTVVSSEVMDKPNYDLVSLESFRADEYLVVKLKVAGAVESKGDVFPSVDTDGKSGLFSGTLYNVIFVNKTFKEVAITGSDLPIFQDNKDRMIQDMLMYINGTFFGTFGTTGQKLDESTLQWRIPLAEVADLDATFGLYGFVFRFEQITVDEFRAYADSIGTGSITPFKPNVTEDLEKIVTIDKRKVEVSITTIGQGGSISVEKVDKPGGILPSDTGELGIYIDIELTGVPGAESIFFTIGYNDSDIPEGFKEKDIKIFYYDMLNATWKKVTNSGVWANNNTIWARPAHLTIFTPLAEPGAGGKEPTDAPDFSFIYIMIAVAVIVIILVVVVVVALILKSKSRKKHEPAPTLHPRPRPRGGRALSPKFMDCPHCGVTIEVPFIDSDTRQVVLQCPDCGSRGKIDNPYLGSDEVYEPDVVYEPTRDEDYDHARARPRARPRPRPRPRTRPGPGPHAPDHDRGPGYARERDYGGRYGGEDVELEYTPPGRRSTTSRRAATTAGARARVGPGPGPEPRARAGARTRTTEPEPGPRYTPPAREREYDYDRRHRQESATWEDEPKEAEVEDEDYEYKDCPKCGERVPVPYAEDDKVVIECPSCGAKGRVKNPYIQ